MTLPAKIETAANAATFVVAVLLSVVLVKTYLVPQPKLTPTVNAAAPELSPGKNMDAHLLGVDWAKNHRTLVIVISTACHFCKDSLPFYRKLDTPAAGVKMVAVLPQPVTEARQYLDNAGVHVDDIRQIALSKIGVRATPTLLLVNDAGIVTDVWVGRLEPEKETQVLSAIERKIAGL
jgi:hypothetical protein